MKICRTWGGILSLQCLHSQTFLFTMGEAFIRNWADATKRHFLEMFATWPALSQSWNHTAVMNV